MHVCQTGAEFDGTVKIEIRGSSSAREATKKSFSFVMAREESAAGIAGSNSTSKKMSGFMGEWQAVKKQGPRGYGGAYLVQRRAPAASIAAKRERKCCSKASKYPGVSTSSKRLGFMDGCMDRLFIEDLPGALPTPAVFQRPGAGCLLAYFP